ncbi:acetate--CoA ligase family protein [Sphingopyxis terrae]|uniref:acetate--CoA ligase family protein n=1 Tax=Sphingopyxis terrae TaxID=33052 RepID=UPI002A175ACF|nr:acetate--CoA ligase family protein [Sphingopyxis terrae]MDX8356426.1 acetate--CoA ligase family protein [Sphingopyxis terrae]
MTGVRSLGESLLRPRSVALIGASDDRSKTTARPLQYLRQAGFAGRIFPVNPRRASVLGEPAWPALEALPEVPDHAFILTPTDGVADAVRACVEAKVPLVTVLAGGFGEEGPAGHAREQALAEILAGGSTRLLGPNSIGIVNVETGLTLTANAAFAEPELPKGSLFVASHSGSMIGAILSRGIARNMGFAGFVSTGAELDLSLGEICEAVIDDPAIEGFLLFLESIRHGEALHRFALAAAARGKPVIAYKLGRSDQAAELAQSHTGAIAGEDGIADAFLRDIGIARVETIDGLIEGGALLRRTPVSHNGHAPQVAVVTTTGGGAAMVVDQLGVRGVSVAEPTPATLAALQSAGIAAAPSRIVDLTLAGTRPAVMKAAIETLAAAPEFDMVVAVAGSSARFQPDLLVPAIAEAAAAARVPVAAFITPDAPDALLQLTAAGVPCFRTPEACADAIAATFARRPAKPRAAAQPPGRERMLDEAEGYSWLAARGIAAAEHVVTTASKRQSPIGYPVAVKLLSADVLHKTDLGGVILGVVDDEGFGDAVDRIVAAVPQHAPEIKVDRLLVQRMVAAQGEVLLSARRDPDAGVLVMLAAGGVLAEIHKDRSLRLAPVSIDEAWKMIGEVKALRALEGYRGRPRGDLAALAEAIVSLSLAGPELVEAEINPLLVLPEGCGVAAVDAVVRIVEASSQMQRAAV